MAAGRDMTARLIVRLQDRLSAGLASLQRRLGALAGTASRLGAVAAIATGLTLAGPIREAAAFDDILRQTAITAGRTGPAVESTIATWRAAYERLALSAGQTSADIARAAALLIAAGLPEDRVQAFLPVLARTATATGAALADLSSVAVNLADNLKIGPEEMERALAMMTQAGKEGRFELRDMAREFPSLTAAAEAVGLSGTRGVASLAAMLQVARRGAGTASEAANNLANFLQKITAPDAVRNFRDLGVDLQAVLRNAARDGINPVEAVVQQIARVTRGDPFKLGQLFGDMQVLNFLRPMLAARQEYARIRDAAMAASVEMLKGDMESRWRGLTIQLGLAEERVTQFGRRLAVAAGTNLVWINQLLDKAAETVSWFDSNQPGMLDQVMQYGTAIAVAAAGLGLIGTALRWIWRAVAAVLLPVLRLVLSPLRLLFAILAAIVGGPAAVFLSALAAISAAALLIRRYWAPISGFFSDLWARLSDAAGPHLAWVRDTLAAAWESAARRLREAWEPVGTFLTGLWETISRSFWTVFQPIADLIDRIGRLGQGEGRGALSEPEGQQERRERWRDRGRLYSPMSAPAPGGGAGGLGGVIEIRVTGPGEVVRAEAADQRVRFTSPGWRGPTFARA